MSKESAAAAADGAETVADEDERPSAPPRVARKPPPSIWQRATYRWTAITSVLAVMLVVYTQHPYYQGSQFAPWRPAFTGGFLLWLAFGIFYVRATLLRFQGTRYMMRDAGLHLVMLGRAWQQKRFWRLAKRPRVRTTLLAMVVKAFFTPLMTGFVAGHATTIMNLWLRHKHAAPLDFKIPHGSALAQTSAWFHQFAARVPDMLPASGDFSGLFSPGGWTEGDVSWGLDLLYNVVFFVDCGVALIGYASESRWLGNKTRSVEPTGLGWVACIFCYPPYNNVLGTYLPLHNGAQIINGATALLALRAITVFLFAIYASATVAFGFKFSNLTNRGIVSRGPYRFVRHPAYLCKCTAWWLEHLPTMTPVKAVFLTALCGVYGLRAWTEERHLGRDPDYRAYKKKVPWVVFPGIY